MSVFFAVTGTKRKSSEAHNTPPLPPARRLPELESHAPHEEDEPYWFELATIADYITGCEQGDVLNETPRAGEENPPFPVWAPRPSVTKVDAQSIDSVPSTLTFTRLYFVTKDPANDPANQKFYISYIVRCTKTPDWITCSTTDGLPIEDAFRFQVQDDPSKTVILVTDTDGTRKLKEN
jgi:hypothetical protein